MKPRPNLLPDDVVIPVPGFYAFVFRSGESSKHMSFLLLLGALGLFPPAGSIYLASLWLTLSSGGRKLSRLCGRIHGPSQTIEFIVALLTAIEPPWPG